MGVTIYLMRSETITNPFLSIPILFALTLALIAAACSNEPRPPNPIPHRPRHPSLHRPRRRPKPRSIRPNPTRRRSYQRRPGTSPDLLSLRRDAATGRSDRPRHIPGMARGTAGVYRANLTFDQSGDWGLGIIATLSDDSTLNVGAKIQVKQTSSTPAIGSPAPRSHTKTASDANNLTDITTDPKPDPDLYRLAIADALDETEPLLVTFATPAYCRTATCGPQMNVLKQLKDRYADRMNFIHVEVYDNPAQIREQGFSTAKIAPALAEWGLPSEPGLS